MKVCLWVQNPPRRQWVMKIIHDAPLGMVVVRTWFAEYDPDGPAPPPAATVPVALACAAIARAALINADSATKYQVEIRA